MLFAHSADPNNLSGAELFGDWILALVTLILTGGMSWVALAPMFRKADAKGRQELLGWVGIGLGLLIAMGSWITRQSVEAALTPPPPPVGMHMIHGSQNGGQVVMWGDYHAELARLVSGEYRLWLSDQNEHPIGAAFFSGKLVPRDPRTQKVDEARAVTLETSLDGLSRDAQLPPEVKSVQLQLVYPGNTIKMDFVFDDSPRRKSLMQWCGSRPAAR